MVLALVAAQLGVDLEQTREAVRNMQKGGVDERNDGLQNTKRLTEALMRARSDRNAADVWRASERS